MNFCEILHEFLKDNDMTQRLFAERVGVKQSQVSEWLKGKAKPNYDTLKKIEKNFSCVPYFCRLLFGNDQNLLTKSR